MWQIYLLIYLFIYLSTQEKQLEDGRMRFFYLFSSSNKCSYMVTRWQQRLTEPGPVQLSHESNVQRGVCRASGKV